MLCEREKNVEVKEFMWESVRGRRFSTLLKFSTARIYQNTLRDNTTPLILALVLILG